MAEFRQTYDKERLHWNTAWLKTHGQHVEVVINPDEALAYRKSKGAEPEVRECLRSEEIFTNAKKGELAREEFLQNVFGTTDPLKVAREIILRGEIQMSAEHRAQIRDELHNQVVSRIQEYAIDPTTGLPHPQQRIELAMEETKAKVDPQKDVERNVHEIVKRLRPVLPIRLEMVTLQVHLPPSCSQKVYGDLGRHGTLKKTEWLQDGGLVAWIELPAGTQGEFMEEMGSRTHGAADIKKVDENPLR